MQDVFYFHFSEKKKYNKINIFYILNIGIRFLPT